MKNKQALIELIEITKNAIDQLQDTQNQLFNNVLEALDINEAHEDYHDLYELMFNIVQSSNMYPIYLRRVSEIIDEDPALTSDELIGL